MCLQILIHAFRTFHGRGIGADDPDFSVDLTWSTATIHTPEILYIIRINCYDSQGDPDSSFPYLATASSDIENHTRIFITFFNISSFTAHIQRFWMLMTNSAVFAKIFISQKLVFFPTWLTEWWHIKIFAQFSISIFIHKIFTNSCSNLFIN